MGQNEPNCGKNQKVDSKRILQTNEKNPRKPRFSGINRIDFSVWRTEVRDERPSDRTAESHKAQTLAAQGFAGLDGKFNLKFNLKSGVEESDLLRRTA